MQIKIAELKPEEGREYTGQEEVMLLDGKAKHDPLLSTSVHYELTANYVTDELLVNGKVWADVRFTCSRCADDFSVKLEEKRFYAAKEVFNRNESVDLTEEIREAIVCAFPSHPVCKPDCKGLCPHCGVNLNSGKCSCKPVSDGVWQALSGLNLKKE